MIVWLNFMAVIFLRNDFDWFLQDESLIKQHIKLISMATYLLLACQLINGITIQPYLVYKLRGNLKVVTFVEYISFFVITAAELYKGKVFYDYLEIDLQTKIMKGQYQRELLHAIATIQKHMSSIRKCMLTLITSDFRQLICHPICFKEYMLFRKQISRHAFILAFTFFSLRLTMFEYLLQFWLTMRLIYIWLWPWDIWTLFRLLVLHSIWLL